MCHQRRKRPSKVQGTDSVAQLVEQYTFNVRVLGSNPSGITKKAIFFLEMAFLLLRGTVSRTNTASRFLWSKHWASGTVCNGECKYFDRGCCRIRFRSRKMQGKKQSLDIEAVRFRLSKWVPPHNPYRRLAATVPIASGPSRVGLQPGPAPPDASRAPGRRSGVTALGQHLFLARQPAPGQRAVSECYPSVASALSLSVLAQRAAQQQRRAEI